MSMKEHHRRAAVRWRNVKNEPWWDQGACQIENKPPEVVKIPDMAVEGRYEQREAALYCHTYCAVREACLQFAKDTGEENYVWGGTTATERKHLMKKDRQARQQAEGQST